MNEAASKKWMDWLNAEWSQFMNEPTVMNKENIDNEMNRNFQNECWGEWNGSKKEELT